MNARKGNWTLQQLLLDLEARVTELEAANHYVYVHHVTFTASNIDNICVDIINDTDTPFTSVTLLEHLFALPENTRIMCTGGTPTSVSIMSLEKQGNEIKANLVDTDSNNFTTLTLLTDYVEQIRI